MTDNCLHANYTKTRSIGALGKQGPSDLFEFHCMDVDGFVGAVAIIGFALCSVRSVSCSDNVPKRICAEDDSPLHFSNSYWKSGNLGTTVNQIPKPRLT